MGKTCITSILIQALTFVPGIAKKNLNGIKEGNLLDTYKNPILRSEWILGVKSFWKYIKGEY